MGWLTLSWVHFAYDPIMVFSPVLFPYHDQFGQLHLPFKAENLKFEHHGAPSSAFNNQCNFADDKNVQR
jgi:hypothetical protein